jgi:hypothetical protein
MYVSDAHVVSMYNLMCILVPYIRSSIHMLLSSRHMARVAYRCVKLIAFELAAKFSRRGENPVQPRLCNAKNAVFKRLKTGFSLRSRSSPANSNAISFMLVVFTSVHVSAAHVVSMYNLMCILVLYIRSWIRCGKVA